MSPWISNRRQTVSQPPARLLIGKVGPRQALQSPQQARTHLGTADVHPRAIDIGTNGSGSCRACWSLYLRLDRRSRQKSNHATETYPAAGFVPEVSSFVASPPAGERARIVPVSR